MEKREGDALEQWTRDFIAKQEPMDSYFVRILTEHYWDLLEGVSETNDEGGA